MKKQITNEFKFTLLLAMALIGLQACSPQSAAVVDQPVLKEATSPAENLTSSEPIEVEIETVVQEVETPAEVEVEEEIITPNQPESTADLTEAEIAGLIYMREEEKLAHDVYLALYDLWGLPLFQNIAGSEQTHTNAVKQLLNTFNIPDPADTSPAGTFTNPDLQALYDDLTAIGEKSLGDALKVGAAIEEIDILDLEEYLTEVQNISIQRVYENLLRGSENHLRAFTSTLLRNTGETYQPQYMTKDAYEQIIAADTARGGRGQGRGRRP